MARKPRGRELYIGVVTDEPFGPVIAFGAGGTLIELYRDHAMELPPLNQFLARRLMERSRVHETLGPWRRAPAVDMAALEQVLLRVSEMVCELPQLREMDINPIIVDEHGVLRSAAPRVQVPADREPATPTKPRKPVVRTWWFWTVIGAAVVGTSLGLGLGLGLRDREPGRLVVYGPR